MKAILTNAVYKEKNLQPQDFDDYQPERCFMCFGNVQRGGYSTEEVKKAVSEAKTVFIHKSAEEIQKIWENRKSLEDDVVIAELRIPNKINDYATVALIIDCLDWCDEEDKEDYDNKLTLEYSFDSSWIDNEETMGGYEDCEFLESHNIKNMKEWGKIEAFMKYLLIQRLTDYFT